MSPEANKPDTQIGSDKFVDIDHPTDRARVFKHGELSDVHEALIEERMPDTAGDIDPHTLEVPVDKIPIAPVETIPTVSTPETSPKKRRLATAVAGIVGAAVLGGGLAVYKSAQSDEPTREGTSVSSGPNQNEAPSESTEGSPEEVSIENLMSPSSKEQVQYIIDNPVSVEDFPDPVDAVVEIGKHSNVLFLADPTKFTPAESEAMYASIYDSTSPYYEGSKVSMEQRREIVASQFILHGDQLEASFSLQPTVTTAESSPEGAVVNTNIIYSGNVLDFMGGNPDTTIDYNADIVLSNDGTNWHIYAGNSNHEVGDIG